MISARPSPLILVHKFVPKVRFEATQDFTGEPAVAYGNVSITVRQNIQWSEENEFWAVDVSVECWPAEDVVLPYRFEVATFGAFRIHPGIVPEAEHKVFVASNGSAVLYGWVREIVRYNTAIGPFGSVELPLLFFPRTPAPLEP